MGSSTLTQIACLVGYLAVQASAYNPTQTPLSCTSLIAVSCVAKGLNQCCIAGGDCCPDGSCCGVGQTCLQSGSGYQCCNTSTDCPNASSASAPGNTPFHAQKPCSPVDGYSWYCDYTQSCGFSQGSCIGVASGGNGGSGSTGSTGSTGSGTNHGSSDGSSSGDASASSSPSASPSGSTSGSGSGNSNSAPGRPSAMSMDLLALLAMYLLA